MKKIFTLMMFMCCTMVAMAQQLSFVVEGKALENGSKFISDKMKVTALPPLGTQYLLDPEMMLNTEKDGNVVITVESLKGTFSFCSFDGSCIIVNEGETKTKTGVVQAGSEQDMLLHYDTGFIQGDAPVVTVEAMVTAYYEDTPSEKMTLHLVLSTDPEVTAIEEVVSDDATVSFEGNTLKYAFASEGEKVLTVYSVNGVQVMQTSVNAQNGVITLPVSEGIYLYSIEGKGFQKSGKVCIK